MATFGNVIWFLVIGWWTPLLWLLLAGIFAITIIGLPLARACLEFAKLTAFPFGKEVIRDTELLGKNNVSGVTKTINIILGIIWFPFGLLLTIAYFVLAISFFVTIIGIPFGIAFVRIGKFILFPMGARVVSKEQAHAIATANEIEVNNTPNSNKDGQAIASLISGIIGLSLVPIIGSIVGLITGVLGLKSTKRNLAIAGLVISIIGLLIFMILGFYFISQEGLIPPPWLTHPKW